MRILLIGGGGHCLSCIDAIEMEGRYSIAGIVERLGSSESSVHGYPVLGTDASLAELLAEVDSALVTVGQMTNWTLRRNLFEAVLAAGVTPALVRAPDCSVSPRADVGVGSIVLSVARVNAGARVGMNCIVNSQALIEHGAEIGDHTHIATGALVNGDVRVGMGTFIGSGAVIREGVTIGDHVVIGAGALVGSDVPTGMRVAAHWSGHNE